MSYDITVTPGEIREAWTAIQAGQNPFSERQSQSGTVKRFSDYRSRDHNAFIGASGPEIQGRLEHGYTVEAKDLTLSTGETDTAMATVLLDEEQGDLLLDCVLGGEDLYRAQWSEMEAPRSLTIRACIGMHAAASASVLSDYTTWVLKVIATAQSNGYTPDVELWFATKGGLVGSDEDRMTVRIPLVKAGEMIDQASWQAYLAPGAFRSLGFVAMALAADKTPKRLNAGMGSPTNKQWRTTYADGVLDIECPGGAKSFPEDQMDKMLEAAYAA